ncbi:hypothetical protein WNZ15_04955 [Roseibium sp. AS2]|uniref:hypothetical protein n=1 Tax=Roseibium sp. AS2 TaxID=3135781 RepID=UPI003178D8A1
MSMIGNGKILFWRQSTTARPVGIRPPDWARRLNIGKPEELSWESTVSWDGFPHVKVPQFILLKK